MCMSVHLWIYVYECKSSQIKEIQAVVSRLISELGLGTWVHCKNSNQLLTAEPDQTLFCRYTD